MKIEIIWLRKRQEKGTQNRMPNVDKCPLYCCSVNCTNCWYLLCEEPLLLHIYQCHCPHTNVCAWKDCVRPHAEGNLSFVRRMWQRCSVRCLFYVVVQSECRRFVGQTLNCFVENCRRLFRNLSSSGVKPIKIFNINEFMYMIWKWKFITES